MKQSDNIEKIFKESFEHFEADVNPNVWTHVQHGISSAPSGGIASSAAKFTIGKIIAGAASVALITGSVWYFASSENKSMSPSDTKNQTILPLKDQPKNIVSENQRSESASNAALSQNPPASALHSSEKTPTTETSVQNISEQVKDETKADVSSRDNSTSASQSAHKYGKASQEPTTPVGGNQIQSSQPKSQTNNLSSDNQNIEQVPTTNIFASVESGDAPLTVTFSNQGVSSSLNWDFGDGSSSRENAPSHTFDKPGNYVVKLSAKNSSGNASDKITIEVKSISSIGNVPNIFTPNYDGENDFFSFEMKNIASIEVIIADSRTLKTIYRWTTLEGKWDGKTNGVDAPEGVYLYTIQATGTDGTILAPKKGFIELKRSSQ